MKTLIPALVLVGALLGIYLATLLVKAFTSKDPTEKKERKEAKKTFKRYDGVPYGGKVPNPEGEPLSLADTIVRSLETRRQDWLFTQYTVVHKPSKRCLWTANEADSCTGYHELFGASSIGFIQPEDRQRVWNAVKAAERANGKAAEHKAAKRLL